MSADAGEDEAVFDVKVPTKRPCASDDEADEVEFHDAAEYAASVASNQAVDREDRDAEESRSEDAYEGAGALEVAGDEEAVGTEEQSGDQDQLEQPAADQKRAKLREPFEVPTSGAFWLHDDRFGGDEQLAEPARPSSTAAERKARSDTEGRWLHDKFSTLELGEAADDDLSDDGFSHYRRGRGRGVRGGGRRGSGRWGGGGGRGTFTVSGRNSGPGAGRGRDDLYTSSTSDRYTRTGGGGTAARSDLGGNGGGGAAGIGWDAGGASSDTREALPQRQARTQRAAAAPSQAEGPPPSGWRKADGAEGDNAAVSANLGGPGWGRGSPGTSGGRSGEVAGRVRGERGPSLEDRGAYRDYGSGPEAGSGGRGRGPAGRGRDQDGWGRDGGPPGRGDYGRGSGRGYAGRGMDAYRASEAFSSNGGTRTYEGGRGRGRLPGRPVCDYQGRGIGLGRGPSSTGRGPPAAQRQQYGRPEEALDDEFPPLPSGSPARKPAGAPLQADMPPGVSAGGSAAAAADVAAPATQGVRRYSRMAGKVGGGAGGANDTNSGVGGGASSSISVVADGSENGRARGGGGEGGAAARTSKLSAAAPTFEPSPAVAAAATGQAGRQSAAQQQQAPLTTQLQQAQQPAPSVPVAFGAPLQPMTVIPTGPSTQLMGGVVSEQHVPGFPLQPGQPGMAYMYPPPQQQQHMQPSLPPQQQQQHPQAPVQPVPAAAGGYMTGPVQPQQQVSGMPSQVGGGDGSPMATPQGGMPYAFMGAMMYGASPAEVEAWYQDAYQKALATGMDPQQAYSAVQGYVQGLNMAYTVMEQQRRQQQQQMGPQPYAGAVPQMQMQAPPVGVAAYDAAAKAGPPAGP